MHTLYIRYLACFFEIAQADSAQSYCRDRSPADCRRQFCQVASPYINAVGAVSALGVVAALSTLFLSLSLNGEKLPICVCLCDSVALCLSLCANEGSLGQGEFSRKEDEYILRCVQVHQESRVRGWKLTA